jgi:hypothetical protein
MRAEPCHGPSNRHGSLRSTTRGVDLRRSSRACFSAAISAAHQARRTVVAAPGSALVSRRNRASPPGVVCVHRGVLLTWTGRRHLASTLAPDRGPGFRRRRWRSRRDAPTPKGVSAPRWEHLVRSSITPAAYSRVRAPRGCAGGRAGTARRPGRRSRAASAGSGVARRSGSRRAIAAAIAAEPAR